jgi:putative tricarboxylic transport membrane protein
MNDTTPGPGRALLVNFNTAIALLSIALGLAIWFLIPLQVQEPPRFFGRSSSGLSPKIFPSLVAAGFVVIGAVYFIASLRLREVNHLATLTMQNLINLAVTVVIMVAYVLLLRPIGFVASSVIVATSISLYYGSRDPIGIGIVGLLAPFAIFTLFTRYLSVSLPPFPRF